MKSGMDTDIITEGLSSVFIFKLKAFDDYVTLHNSSMPLTYVVIPYHIIQY